MAHVKLSLRRSAAGLAGAFLALALLVAGLPQPAAAIEREELRRQVAEAFNAEVLKIRKGQVDGQAVWIVTLMREGGNHNAAFKVDTIAVDAETGEPLLGRDVADPRPAESLDSTRTKMMEMRPEVLRDRPWR